MSLEARLPQAAILKKLLDAIKDLVSDANFDCSSTGISLQAMDSSHVSLVSVLLRKDGFDKYSCKRDATLGINLASMAKILKCAATDDILTLKADAESKSEIDFVFESASADKITEFKLKLMEIDSEHLEIPDTEYKAVVKMPASEFQKICRDLTMFGDTVVINVDKEGVTFSVKGECAGSITVKQSGPKEGEESGSVSISLEEKVSLTFALRYLSSFAKATALSSTVTLALSPDAPLVVGYDIEELGFIKFYLAPKIEDE